MIDPNLIKAIAKSDYKDNLVKYLEQMKSEIADVRNGDYSMDVRKAVIDFIDKLLIDKLRISTSKQDKEVDDYS